MKKYSFRLMLFVVVLWTVSGCKKDAIEPSPIIGKWYYVDEYAKDYYKGNFYHDTTVYFNNSDYTQFSDDNKGTTVRADTSFTFSYTYNAAGNEIVAVLDGDTTHVHYQVKILTSNSLVLYFEQASGADFLFTYLLTFKK